MVVTVTVAVAVVVAVAIDGVVAGGGTFGFGIFS